MTEFHGIFVVVRSSIDSSHHTLIITEEENGQSGNAIDRNQEAPFLQPVDDIGPRNEIHGGDGLPDVNWIFSVV